MLSYIFNNYYLFYIKKSVYLDLNLKSTITHDPWDIIEREGIKHALPIEEEEGVGGDLGGREEPSLDLLHSLSILHHFFKYFSVW